MFCKNCGQQIADNAAFCNNCGATTNAAPANNQAPSNQQQAPQGQYQQAPQGQYQQAPQGQFRPQPQRAPQAPGAGNGFMGKINKIPNLYYYIASGAALFLSFLFYFFGCLDAGVSYWGISASESVSAWDCNNGFVNFLVILFFILAALFIGVYFFMNWINTKKSMMIIPMASAAWNIIALFISLGSGEGVVSVSFNFLGILLLLLALVSIAASVAIFLKTKAMAAPDYIKEISAKFSK